MGDAVSMYRMRLGVSTRTAFRMMLRVLFGCLCRRIPLRRCLCLFPRLSAAWLTMKGFLWGAGMESRWRRRFEFEFDGARKPMCA